MSHTLHLGVDVESPVGCRQAPHVCVMAGLVWVMRLAGTEAV